MPYSIEHAFAAADYQSMSLEMLVTFSVRMCATNVKRRNEQNFVWTYSTIRTTGTMSQSTRNEMDSDIRMVLDLIASIVKANQPYKEKVQRILAECDEDDRMALSEFLAWFEGVEL